MDISFKCVDCTIKKADSILEQYEPDIEKRSTLREKVIKVINESPAGDTSPYLNARIMRILNMELNLGDIYFQTKKEYNQLLLSMEDEILESVHSSQDKLLAALKYALIGNYIDFAALDNVDAGKLKSLINKAFLEEINDNEYIQFRRELEVAIKLVYIVDNAGEIVLDKICIKVIKELYPDLKVDVIVRGAPIHNDAITIDAEEIGLASIALIISNGTDIPGTQLSEISGEALDSINSADLIIAKGQGNFETLFGCNKNIYYLFLCKCDLFVKRFSKGKLHGIFVNEKHVQNMIIDKE